MTSRALVEFDHTGAGITMISGPTVQEILAEVAKKYGVTVLELVGDRRDRMIVRARQEAMWRCSKETGKSGAAIARLMRRDHTSVIAGVRRHEERMRENNARIYVQEAQ